MVKSATVALSKPHTYYGLRYTQSVKAMAKLANVSLRTMKGCLKLHSMGYQDRIAEGWTMAQCYADAGQERTRRAAPRVDDLDDAVCEIKRLRGLLLDLGVDPDG